MNQMLSKIDQHDSSAPLTRGERIAEAMSQDIRSGGDITSDLVACELMLDEKGQFKSAFLLRLADAVEDVATTRERRSDRKLGEYIRKQLIEAMQEVLEDS